MDPCGTDVLPQLRRGVLDYVVLAELQREPTYGHALVQRVSPRDHLLVSEGTIYPLLARLRRQGWIHSEWQESPSGPARRLYSVTDAGEAALRQFVAVWSTFARQVEDALKGVAP